MFLGMSYISSSRQALIERNKLRSEIIPINSLPIHLFPISTDNGAIDSRRLSAFACRGDFYLFVRVALEETANIRLDSLCAVCIRYTRKHVHTQHLVHVIHRERQV